MGLNTDRPGIQAVVQGPGVGEGHPSQVRTPHLADLESRRLLKFCA